MFEKIMVVFAVFSLAAKFVFVLPEGDVFLTVCLALLAAAYFPFGIFLFREKHTGTNKIYISIINGIVLALVLTGILLTLLYRSWGKFTLQAGIVLAAVATIFILYKRSKAPDEPGLRRYYRQNLQRNLVVLFTALAIYFVPTNTLIRLELRNDPKLAEMVIGCRETDGEANCWEEIRAYRENKILDLLNKGH